MQDSVHPQSLHTQRLLGLSKDPTSPLGTPEMLGGLKTCLFEGPKFIGSLWVTCRNTPHFRRSLKKYLFDGGPNVNPELEWTDCIFFGVVDIQGAHPLQHKERTALHPVGSGCMTTTCTFRGSAMRVFDALRFWTPFVLSCCLMGSPAETSMPPSTHTGLCCLNPRVAGWLAMFSFVC